MSLDIDPDILEEEYFEGLEKLLNPIVKQELVEKYDGVEIL